jgi:predicted RNA-binding Zn ribbon-like protein
MALAEIKTHIEFSGGRLCLDFANTSVRPTRPRELINSYSDLISWSQQAGIITDHEAQRLTQEAARRPGEAALTLERAIVLREALYSIFSAVADMRSPDEADLALLNGELAQALAMSRIVPRAASFAWGWVDDEERLERMLWPVARSAADLLTSEELHAVRECAASDCSWLFMDTSKNKSRRWCDMKTCGNRVKARQHYHRNKAASSS